MIVRRQENREFRVVLSHHDWHIRSHWTVRLETTLHQDYKYVAGHVHSLKIQGSHDSWSLRQLVALPLQPGSRKNADIQLTLSFLIQPGTPVYGMGVPSFRVGLPCSLKPFWKHPYDIRRGVFPWWFLNSSEFDIEDEPSQISSITAPQSWHSHDSGQMQDVSSRKRGSLDPLCN